MHSTPPRTALTIIGITLKLNNYNNKLIIIKIKLNSYNKLIIIYMKLIINEYLSKSHQNLVTSPILSGCQTCCFILLFALAVWLKALALKLMALALKDWSFDIGINLKISDGGPALLMAAIECKADMKQELSYRKQIARQLRRQCVEGIYRPKYYTVALKSRLRVTESHWKRNHWIDHTYQHDLLLVELFDVEYYRDLEMWVRGH